MNTLDRVRYFRRCFKQILERFPRLADDAERVLQRPTEKV